MKNFFVFFISAVVIAGIVCLSAMLFYFGWNWFLVSVFAELDPLTFNQAVLLYCAKTMICYKYKEKGKDKRSDIEKCKSLGLKIATPCMMLAVMWVAKLILL